MIASADISVVIPSYNRRQRVQRAVESVRAGRARAGEIVVVDDGSTDGTARAFEATDDVRLLRLPENLGVAAARNRGIEVARGPWLALLDSDDVWLPEHLERLVAHVEANPECRVVQTRERWYRHGRRVNPRPVHRPPRGDIFVPSLARCLVSSSAVLLRRDVLQEVGGYDERLPACEDYDLWLRMARRVAFDVVPVETIVKDGGRPDQLSRRTWGLDRFRVFALAKLLVAGLSAERRAPTLETARAKLRILAGGADRRGDEAAVAAYQRWLDAVERLQAGEPAPLTALLEEADRPGRQRDPILDGLLGA